MCFFSKGTGTHINHNLLCVVVQALSLIIPNKITKINSAFCNGRNEISMKGVREMPREKEAYRDNLESLKEFLHSKYGDNRHLMRVKDVCEYVGRSPDFVRKYYNINKTGVSIETFARQLS